jgi:hypothetical protein
VTSDDLDSLEAQMQSAGGIPPAGHGSASASALDLALENRPHDLQVKIMRVVSARGLDENDPALDLFNAASISADSAAVISEAAREVREGVGKIQSQIFSGALKAGESIRVDLAKALDDKLAEGGTAIVRAIDGAGDRGAAKIQQGAADLLAKIDRGIEAKKQEGINAFARAAAEAAQEAARAAASRRFALSSSVIAVILIAATAAGGFASYEFLRLTNRLAPSPLVLNDRGQPICGDISLATGEKPVRVCEVTKPAAAIELSQ